MTSTSHFEPKGTWSSNGFHGRSPNTNGSLSSTSSASDGVSHQAPSASQYSQISPRPPVSSSANSMTNSNVSNVDVERILGDLSMKLATDNPFAAEVPFVADTYWGASVSHPYAMKCHCGGCGQCVQAQASYVIGLGYLRVCAHAL
jgi:hypothetical protein